MIVMGFEGSANKLGVGIVKEDGSILANIRHTYLYISPCYLFMNNRNEEERREREKRREQSRVRRAESREQRAESREQRAESREQRAESREQRAESREQRAESREQRAESREQRAESREQRAERSYLIVYRYITPPGTGFLPKETALHHQQRIFFFPFLSFLSFVSSCISSFIFSFLFLDYVPFLLLHI